jgi:AcrR family transcriptional regulator
MAGRKVQISASAWVETARQALIEEGIVGVKVDHLASRLGVTRGGFYHNFTDREKLLDRLLDHWEQSCCFLPSDRPGVTPADAASWLDTLLHRLIDEDGYDHNFDMAVRDWARADPRASWAVERADHMRMATLTDFFEALGYDNDEAVIRARVFYFHQIGYYAIGLIESTSGRKRTASKYVDILCGHDVMEPARDEIRHRKMNIANQG